MSFLKILIVTLAAFTIFGNAAFAAEFPQKPSSDNFYVDEAGLITPEDRAAINAIAKELLSTRQVPLFVVTIPSLISYKAGTLTVQQYAQALFDYWGIGSQERNYGVLLLISKGDREARIEFGKAWNHEHDNDAKEIMDTLIIPPFKKGNYSLCIKQGVNGLSAVIHGLKLPSPEPPKWLLPATIIGLIIIVGTIISLFKSGRSGWGWILITVFAALIAYIAKNNNSNRSNRSSSGGFRGGSSGGGGASGKW